MDWIVKTIKNRLEERGTTIKFVANKVPMNPDFLSKVLLGQRRLFANEFVMICKTLDLNFEDFAGESRHINEPA